MQTAFLRMFSAIVMLAAGVSACGDASSTSGGTSSSGGGGTSTTSGTSTGGDATTAGTSAGGAGGTGGTATGGTGGSRATTASGGTTGSGMIYGYCTPPCSTPADCCPPDTPSCPGDNFPDNYTCKNGGCRSPECSSTADCTALNPKLDCLVLSGTHDCAFPCIADGDCMMPLKCVGADDNGTKFCLATGGSGCSDDSSCQGLGKCINKVCVCASDMDCTKSGYTNCAL